jgi:hypothetical protein
MAPPLASGKVVDAQGQPLAGASVYILKGPAQVPDIAQITGPDGQFAMSVPKAGRYRFGANLPGHAPSEQDVDVGTTGSDPIEIRLKEAP